MALNGSGPISLAGPTAGQSIAVELGESATGTIALNDAIVRDLAGIASGAITMPTNFWGKSAIPKGRIYTFGDNAGGRLGINNTIDRSSPSAVGALTTWTQVSVMFSSSSGIKADGTIWTWGYGSGGGLGLNTNPNRSSPTQVGALTNWAQVSVGDKHMVAVKTNGTLWSWGLATDGRLGQGPLVSRSSPVQVGALTTWLQATAGRNFSGAILK